MIQRILLIAVLLCSVGGKLMAQNMTTDRAMETIRPYTVGSKLGFQFEGGTDLYFENDNGKRREFEVPNMMFRLGIDPRLELRYEFPFTVYKNGGGGRSSGIGDMEVGFKYMLGGNESLQVAFLSHLFIPTGNSEHFGTINKLMFGTQVGSAINFTGNIGYDYLGRDDGGGALTYGAAIETGLAAQTTLFVEGFGEWDDFNKCLAEIHTGIIYRLSPAVQADFSFSTGINTIRNALRMGLSFKIG